MNDVRDEALGTILDRAAEGIESEPADRLPEVLRRGNRRRAGRFTALGVSIATFVGAVSWAGLTLPGSDRIPADIGDWHAFASLEANGWMIQLPPTWRVQQLPPCPNAPERIGAIVTNTDFVFRNPQGEPPKCEDRFVWAGFPRDGVAITFQPRGSFSGIFEPPANTSFPITPGSLIQTDSIRGGPAESFDSVVLHGTTLGVIRRFVGPEASFEDVDALDRMLATFALADPPWTWTSATVLSTRVEIRHPGTFEVTRFRLPLVIDAPAPMVRITSPDVRKGLCGPAFWRVLDLGFRRLGPDGVAVVVSDATEAWSPDFPARPARFDLAGASDHDALLCFGQTYEVTVFRFEESRRQIVVEVVTREGGMDDLRASPLEYMLNSIEISTA